MSRGELAAALGYREEYFRHRPEIEDVSLDYYATHLLATTSYFLGDYSQMQAIAQNLLDSSLGQNQRAVACALGWLGFALKCQGDDHRSAGCFSEELSIAWEEKDNLGLLWALAGLVGTAVRLQQPVRAVHLLGAIEKMLETIVTNPILVERTELAKEEAILRQALPTEAFSQAQAEGRAMGMEEVFKEALAMAAGRPALLPKSPL